MSKFTDETSSNPCGDDRSIPSLPILLDEIDTIDAQERRKGVATLIINATFSLSVEDTGKMGGNISRYISLARPIGKISPFVSIVTENQCAFFTSRRTIGKGNAEASAKPFSSLSLSLYLPHCDFSIRVFPFPKLHPFVRIGDRSLRMFRRAIRAEMLQVPSSDKWNVGRASTYRAINLHRRDTRFSNKALHNSNLSYPPLSVDTKR